MDRALFVAMTGAKNVMLGQAINNNNLANANTTGFREDLMQFQSLPIEGEGLKTRINNIVGSSVANLQPGAINETGNELDVAVVGDGWIGVLAENGDEAYTRAGNLQISADGFLVTETGLKIMGDNGPIAIPPIETIEIGADGTVTVLPAGEPEAALAVMGRIKLVATPEGGLTKSEDGLMRSADGNPLMADGSIELKSGALESSNVNTIKAMVNMIELSRRFEMQLKMMSTVKENDKRTSELLA